MAWLKDRSTTTKLMIGFGLVLAVMCVAVGLMVAEARTLRTDAERLEAGIEPAMEASAMMKLAVVQTQQWLTDVSATGDPDGYKDVDEWVGVYREQSKELARLTQDVPGMPESISKATTRYDSYLALGQKMAKAYLEEGRDAGNVHMEVFDKEADDMRGVVNGIEEANRDRLRRAVRDATAMARFLINLMLTGLAVSIAIGLAVGFFFARMIVTNLRAVSAVTELAAKGDLTPRIHVDSKDELGQMGRSFNRMLESFEASLSHVGEAALDSSSAAQQLSEGSEQLSGGALRQASALEETAATLQELTGTVKITAENAKQAKQRAADVRDRAERGSVDVKATIGSMDQISECSRRISAIIGTIDEIAFQTNLLALNAAVEAARAGEHGRSFAVVASEVRALAQRSGSASKEIKALITDSVAKIETGARLVSASGETLGEIMSGVKEVAHLIAGISEASTEEAQGIDQVNKALAQIDSVTQQNAAQTEELCSTAKTMAERATQLQAETAKFKLRGRASPIEPSLAA